MARHLGVHHVHIYYFLESLQDLNQYTTSRPKKSAMILNEKFYAVQ